jgi:hypothetical protein
LNLLPTFHWRTQKIKDNHQAGFKNVAAKGQPALEIFGEVEESTLESKRLQGFITLIQEPEDLVSKF